MNYVRTTRASRRAASTTRYIHISVQCAHKQTAEGIVPMRTPIGQGRTYHAPAKPNRALRKAAKRYIREANKAAQAGVAA